MSFPRGDHTTPPVSVSVTESSAAGEARRKAVGLAREQGLSSVDTARLAIIATEAATNLYKHADRGEIIASPWQGPEGCGVQVLALDRGPGMANLARSLSDGYSTSGSQGIGLGGITRQADLFDIHSEPGLGTVILAVVIGERRSSSGPADGRIEVGAVSVPLPGQPISGDAWAVEHKADSWSFMVVDGLGHGPEAAKAAVEAVATLRRHPREHPRGLIELAHGALRSTRGAAMGVAELSFAQGEIRFAGVGNIRALILAEEKDRHLVSLNGTVGHQLHRVQEYAYPWTARSVLVMASDGLTTAWNLSRYPNFQRMRPGLVAGLLYRDFRRGTDDTTVVVAREALPQPREEKRA